MRKTIVAGNWKMNASKESVNTLIEGILSGMNEVSSEVIVCAPFPYLSQVESLIQGSSLMLGAQNLNVNSAGAYTGEVSADMIKDFGAQHVIVGHSERRSLYAETNAIVAEKTNYNIKIIGDAEAPGLIADAVYLGHLAAQNFEASDADIQRGMFMREMPSLK